MKNKSTNNGISRREFLQATGLTTAALLMPSFLTGCGFTENPGVTILSNGGKRIINTDVLVIGGGMAGTFAAVAAKAKGLSVTLVDKGTVGRSGATPWANTFSVFDESQGHNRDEWISGISVSSEYVNNLDWLDQTLDAAKARWEDIKDWGLLDTDVRHPSLVLREKLLDSGVELVERTMVTTLLTPENNENRVIGAMGFTADEEETIVVLAKATILCAGAGSFKAPGFPIQSLTSDGDAMAYRAGARISGKEYVDFHWTSAETPASCWAQWGAMWNTGVAQTSQVFESGMTLDSAFAIHTGESTSMGSGPGEMPPEGEEGMERPSGPPPDGDAGMAAPEGESGGSRPGMGTGTQVLGAATGLGIHKAEGVWPTSMQGASDVPGLYAAGDGLASMLCGSSYPAIGLSLSGSAVQGMVAGNGAAEYAQEIDAPALSDTAIEAYQTAMFAPRERESGFSPAWLTQVLQNTMFPYFVLFVKQEDRLQAALTNVMFLKENLLPRVTAKDAHDLRLAHETGNMLLNAEMKLRASIFRKESRGTHYREDYPARNDDEWLAWVLLQQDANGQMQVSKENVPDAWKPDLSIPYEERYPNRFPGELEYLGLA